MRLLVFVAFALAILYLLWLVPDFVIWLTLVVVGVINKALAEASALLGLETAVSVDVSWVLQMYSWVKTYAQVLPVAIVVVTALVAVFSIYER